MATRNNVGDLYGMKKSVWATLFHNCGIANEECPYLSKSSCIWWSDKLTPGENKDTNVLRSL